MKTGLRMSYSGYASLALGTGLLLSDRFYAGTVFSGFQSRTTLFPLSLGLILLGYTLLLAAVLRRITKKDRRYLR